MKRRIAMPILAGALLALAPTDNPQRELSMDVLRGYLNRMYAQYVPHPKSDKVFVVTRVTNEHAGRIDLYVEMRDDKSLVLTAYAKEKDHYFNVARALDREKLFQRLLQANYRAFSTFFVDDQGDIGVRFTFTTEDGVGYEPFRVAATQVMRIADEYSPILGQYMSKE